MKKLNVCVIILVVLLCQTVFASQIELDYEYNAQIPTEEAGDLYASSACEVIGDEVIYYSPEALPQTYMQEFELMESANSLEDTLLSGWANLASEISVKEFNIPKAQIGDAVKKVLFSNPIYYYVSSGFSYSTSTKTGCVINIYPTYIHDDTELIESNTAAIEKATDEILFYIDPGMSEIEKIMTVHDYMVFHYDYDDVSENPNRNLLIMTEKKGVCVAYTLAFTHLMNKLGIETLYVSSTPMNHAWNLVKVAGRWYHIDVTWDDPTNAPHYWTSHKYALLSDTRFQALDNPHYGYDLGDTIADSTLYDDSPWHDGMSAIVTVDDVSYWIEGNNIVCETGEVIYENLDGGDSKWSIGSGYVIKNNIFAGLASYNSKLYFNTDKAVYSYNPETKNLKLVKAIEGICGMYIDTNYIYYDMYNINTGTFEDAGTIHLDNTCYSHPYIDGNKLIAKVYRDSDEPLKVLSFGKSGCNIKTVESSGFTSLEFDAESDVFLYFWDENLKPQREKVKVIK